MLEHGNMVTGEDLDLSGMLTLAARRHRVIAIDRPGFGYSDRPHRAMWTPAAQAHLLRQALAALDIDRPIVLGRSFGTAVPLGWRRITRGAVSGPVVLSGNYHPTLRADALISGASALPVIGDVIRYTVSPIVSTMMLPLQFKAMFSPLSPPAWFADSFALEWRRALADPCGEPGRRCHGAGGPGDVSPVSRPGYAHRNHGGH
jgi:pimeloyl-ACP methyl ester carboxylesterase